jgi:hypothetical protein
MHEVKPSIQLVNLTGAQTFSSAIVSCATYRKAAIGVGLAEVSTAGG